MVANHMISDQAQRSFELMFKKAVLANLRSENDECEISSVGDLLQCDAQEFSVLTITSPLFRFLVIFHFSNDETTQSYFTRQSEFGVMQAVDKTLFYDAFLEFCNLCCGSMNRELHNFYTYLGMSTPYVLLKESSKFISELNPGHIGYQKIIINQSVVLYATLCVCEYGEVDFKTDMSNAEVYTSELELF